jgi:hypothetical protein
VKAVSEFVVTTRVKLALVLAAAFVAGLLLGFFLHGA